MDPAVQSVLDVYHARIEEDAEHRLAAVGACRARQIVHRNSVDG
jgi:hypothetical protein